MLETINAYSRDLKGKVNVYKFPMLTISIFNQPNNHT